MLPRMATPNDAATCWSIRLKAEPVPVAADELHDRLHPELLQSDRDRERRSVRVSGGVVGCVDCVDVRLIWSEALVDRVANRRVRPESDDVSNQRFKGRGRLVAA